MDLGCDAVGFTRDGVNNDATSVSGSPDVAEARICSEEGLKVWLYNDELVSRDSSNDFTKFKSCGKTSSISCLCAIQRAGEERVEKELLLMVNRRSILSYGINLMKYWLEKVIRW